MIVLFEDFVLKYIIMYSRRARILLTAFDTLPKVGFFPFLSSPFERLNSFPCISKNSDFVFSILTCIPCNCPFSSSGLYTIFLLSSHKVTFRSSSYTHRKVQWSNILYPYVHQSLNPSSIGNNIRNFVHYK